MSQELTNKTLLNQELFTHEVVGLLADLMLQKGLFLATAESCTGGMIAAACTDLAGSSAWFERGFVSYSNAAKTQMLGVDAALIEQHGAVSEPVARAMSQVWRGPRAAAQPSLWGRSGLVFQSLANCCQNSGALAATALPYGWLLCSMPSNA